MGGGGGIGCQVREGLAVEPGIAPVSQPAKEHHSIGVGVFGGSIADLEQLRVILRAAEPEACQIGFVPHLPQAHLPLKMAHDGFDIATPEVFGVIPRQIQPFG